MTFATRGIYGEAQRLSALAYALDDSPPLHESTDLGRTWSPVVRLSEAKLRRECGADPDCAAGCLQLAIAGLVAPVACGVEPDDGSAVKSAPPTAPSGCALTMTPPRNEPAVEIAMAGFLLAVAMRWRSRVLRRIASTSTFRGERGAKE
jgi:hypothetical protein